MLLKLKPALIAMSLVISALFTSCVAPTLIVEGVGEDTSWLNGKKYLNANRNGMDISIAFSEKSNSILIYEVIVINNSDQSVFVQPEDFDLTTIGNSMVSPINAVAMNPEEQIEEFKKIQQREQSNHQTGQNVDGCLLCVSALAEASSNQPVSAQERERRRRRDQQRQLDRIETNQRHENVQSRLDEILEIWEEEALRKTTLHKGEKLTGKTMFKLSDYNIDKKVLCNNDRITLTALINNVEYNFEFAVTWKENY
jgi:hypothetical protein